MNDARPELDEEPDPIDYDKPVDNGEEEPPEEEEPDHG